VQADEVVAMEGSEWVLVLLGLMVPVMDFPCGEMAMAHDPLVSGYVDGLHLGLANWETVEYAQKSDESGKEELYKEKSVFVCKRIYLKR
jgi:hypothetical protein